MRVSRQALLVCGAIVLSGAALYGWVVPALEQNKDRAQDSITKTQIFIDEQSRLIQMTELKPHEQLTLRMLMEEHPPNPFARQWARIILDQKSITRQSSIEPVLSYDGYIRCGDRMIALINGENYDVGDKIDHVPLTLREITPDKIDVENPNTLSQTRLSVKILPLETDE